MVPEVSTRRFDRARESIRMLRGMVSLHRRTFLIAVAGAAMFALCTVASSIAVQWVTDHVIVPRFEEGSVAVGTVATGVGLIIGIGLLRATGVVIRRTWAGTTQWRVAGTLGQGVVDRLVRQPLSWHDRRPDGDLVARVGVDTDAAVSVLAPVPFATGTVLLIIVSAVFLLSTDLVLGAVAVAVFPLLIGLNVVYQKRVDVYYATAQEHLGALSAGVHESFDGVQLVKAYGAEARETERLAEMAGHLRTARIGAVRLRGTFEALLDVLPSMTNVGLVVLGAARVDSGHITVGQLSSFIYLFTLLVFPLRLIGYALSELPHSLAGWRRVRDVLDEPIEPDPVAAIGVAAPGRGLQLVDVGYTFSGDTRAALRDVSLDIARGRIVAVVGPTGAGKSTLVEIVGGLVPPDAGTVAIGAGGRAIVFQEPFLFAGSIRHNLVLGDDRFGDEDLWEALRLARAERFVADTPHGLDTVVGERGVSLSGGQRQRIALARALVRRPALLLLDDTTSALDPATEGAVLGNLRGVLTGTTVLMVASRPSTIALADEVVYLAAGEVVDHGPHSALMSRQPGYRGLVEAFETDRRGAGDEAEVFAGGGGEQRAVDEPVGRFGAAHTINRGLQEAPVLRQGLGVTWGLAAVGATGRVVVPILLQQAIDKGIVGEGGVDLGFVAMLAVIGAVALFIASLAQRTAVVRLGRRSEQALYLLRARLIAHIHRLSLADHNEERRGALVARVTSDIETLAQFFQWGGLAWLLDGPLMLMVAAVMLAYDWILALVAFAVAAPLALVLRAVQRHLVKAYDEARERNGEMLSAVTEVVTGSATARAYDAGATLGQAADDVIELRTKSQIRAQVIGAFLFPSGEVFSVLTVAAVIVVGVARGPSSGLTAGAMIGFIFLTYRFLEPIAEFTEVLDQTQTAVAGLRRVLGVLDLPVGPPPPDSPRALPPGPLDIDVREVTFSYPTRGVTAEVDAAVLRHVNVHIPAGQQVAMVGATGSGKTTLGRLIARFADPTIGQIRLGGVPLHDVANDELRRRLVVVSQEPFLFDDTIAANIGFARPGTSVPEMDEVVTRLDVGDWVESLPDGLMTRVGERGEQLSAGERQLVALLRAGVADPDVLVLDEATSSVDALTEVRISRALTHLAEGRTTIAIAHRLSTAARADRVLVLEDGRLVEDGHHDELVLAGGVYSHLYAAWMQATATGGPDR